MKFLYSLLSPLGKARMVRIFNRKIHFASAADAPSPSDFVCHLSRSRESIPHRGKQDNQISKENGNALQKSPYKLIIYSFEYDFAKRYFPQTRNLKPEKNLINNVTKASCIFEMQLACFYLS